MNLLAHSTHGHSSTTGMLYSFPPVYILLYPSLASASDWSNLGVSNLFLSYGCSVLVCLFSYHLLFRANILYRTACGHSCCARCFFACFSRTLREYRGRYAPFGLEGSNSWADYQCPTCRAPLHRPPSLSEHLAILVLHLRLTPGTNLPPPVSHAFEDFDLGFFFLD